MPLALFALTIAAYAIGTTEFVVVGLLPTVAEDLGITLPLAGLIVSVYALGVTFGAPVLTALTGRTARKPLLLGLMALFVGIVIWVFWPSRRREMEDNARIPFRDEEDEDGRQR